MTGTPRSTVPRVPPELSISSTCSRTQSDELGAYSPCSGMRDLSADGGRVSRGWHAPPAVPLYIGVMARLRVRRPVVSVLCTLAVAVSVGGLAVPGARAAT